VELPLGRHVNVRLGQASVEQRTGQSNCLNYVLLTSNVAPVDSRHMMVSIGSNASPAVMRRKLRQRSVNATIAFVQANVSGLRVGHSAHVSVPGYIAAAPVLEPSATTPVVVSLLDAEQLECLDATEPNYTRTLLTAEVCQLELEAGERPASFLLYVSKHGVLAPPGQDPLRLMSQQDVYERLRGQLEPVASLFRDSDTQSVMSRLSRDEALRSELLACFRESGWATQSGFEKQVSTVEPPRYGAIRSTWADVAPVPPHFWSQPSIGIACRQPAVGRESAGIVPWPLQQVVIGIFDRRLRHATSMQHWTVDEDGMARHQRRGVPWPSRRARAVLLDPSPPPRPRPGGGEGRSSAAVGGLRVPADRVAGDVDW
jgi:hypothetical protein